MSWLLRSPSIRDSLTTLDGITIVGATAGEMLRFTGATTMANARVQPTSYEWDDVQVAGFQLGSGASAPDLINFTPVTGMQCWGFDGGVTAEQLFGQIELPHAWAAGTEIRPHVHWCPTTNAAGTVRWRMRFAMANVDGVFVAPGVQPLEVIDAASGTAWTNQVASLGAIDMTGYALSTLIAFRLYREPATEGAGKYADDAAMISVGFHVQHDSWGSRQEFIK